MADINIERKRKSPLPWIIGLVVLALLALLLMRGCGDDDVDEGTVVVTDTTTATMATDTSMAPVASAPMDTGAMAAGGAAGGTGWIAGILAGTAAAGGAAATASGDGTVPETPSDRGFWIEENGQRVFAILAEPMEQIKDVDPGQRVRISNARVLRGSESAQIPQDVDAEAKTTAAAQQYFLLVPSSGVQIVAGGNTTPD